MIGTILAVGLASFGLASASAPVLPVAADALSESLSVPLAQVENQEAPQALRGAFGVVNEVKQEVLPMFHAEATSTTAPVELIPGSPFDSDTSEGAFEVDGTKYVKVPAHFDAEGNPVVEVKYLNYLFDRAVVQGEGRPYRILRETVDANCTQRILFKESRWISVANLPILFVGLVFYGITKTSQDDKVKASGSSCMSGLTTVAMILTAAVIGINEHWNDHVGG